MASYTARRAFTHTRFVTVDEEGNTKKAKEDDEDAHPEHINYRAGDEVDLTKDEAKGYEAQGLIEEANK